MKTSLSLGLIVVAASALAACSSDEGNTPRPTAGAGGTGTGNAGSSAGGTSAGGTSAGGTSAGGTGGTGSGVTYTYGPEFTITADGNVVDATGSSEVDGNAFFTQSENMTVDVVVSHRDGGLCFSGETAVVPDSDSYGTYWGGELGLNLKLEPAPEVAGDAGAGDAGAAPERDVIPWPYGDVIGFSYKLVGNDTVAADKGVPPARIRFKALPVGSDGANDNYCSDRLNTTDGLVENVLFDDITFECWTTGNPSIGPDEATINRVDPGPPRLVETPTNPKALQNISWQIASDVVATTPAPIAFDFCITELKAITGVQ